MSFAFGKDMVAFDTNLRRVFSRFLGEKWLKLSPKKQLATLEKLIPNGEGTFFNHALMDIGAIVCLTREPLCEQCPLKSKCLWVAQTSYGRSFQLNRHPIYQFADKPALLRLKINQKFIKVAIGVVIRGGLVLISRRPKHVPFGNMWEFPGGKLQSGEDERTCLKRELQEELGIEVAVRPAFYTTKTIHDDQLLQLSFHRCSLLLGEPKALEVEEFSWVRPEDLFQYQFPPVNTKVIELLLKRKAMFRS